MCSPWPLEGSANAVGIGGARNDKGLALIVNWAP